MTTEGIAKPSKINGFLKSPLAGFIIGQVITFICWLLLAAIAWGKLTRDFEDRDKWQADIEKWRAVTQEDINEFKYGRYEERMRTVEHSTAKIDTIIATQQRIQTDIQSMQKR